MSHLINLLFFIHWMSFIILFFDTIIIFYLVTKKYQFNNHYYKLHNDKNIKQYSLLKMAICIILPYFILEYNDFLAITSWPIILYLYVILKFLIDFFISIVRKS